MIDIFGLVVAFALILLGTSTRNYWFSILVFFITIAIYPDPETVFWMIGAFLIGMVWRYAAKEVTSNQYFFTVLLLVGAILSITLGFVIIGIFFALAMLLVFVFGASFRTGKKVVNKAREEWGELKTDVPKAKGQFPAGGKEVAGIMGTLGAKTGETLSESPETKMATPKLGERISKGAKDLIEGLGRLFK
ncbi:hypothetical protein KKE06_05910 [Candidatus Micrarchaeota archaeon]|nr:hypothetical protein [Candidatus Micrarchaeota archaeon]MBU1930704.1 hypothetical protein [Candidatus Micrarchaeota archaeon]